MEKLSGYGGLPRYNTARTDQPSIGVARGMFLFTLSSAQCNVHDRGTLTFCNRRVDHARAILARLHRATSSALGQRQKLLANVYATLPA
jgi:hypothetical protein